MPKPCPLTPLQAFTAPLAIAQDHGVGISLEPDPSGVALQIARSCSPERIRLASVSPPADPTQLVAEINTHSGCEFVVAAAHRRRAGRPPIALSELRTILDVFVGHGFDEAPYCAIEEIWRSGSELDAALMLLRWTALMFQAADAANDAPALSRLVAQQAERLVAAAESSLDDAQMRRRIDRLVPAVMRRRPMTAQQLSALTADLPSHNAFAKLDWPWLTQRMAARGTDGGCPSDDRPSCTFH